VQTQKASERSSLVIANATIIDGSAPTPIAGKSIWIEQGRVKALGRHNDLGAAASTRVIDARGKYIIPGLMNGNVHLLLDTRLENLVRHEGRYDELIAEAAQITLKNGVTTVFDTWGPRAPLMSVRDRIGAGELPGSRIFCAGNIIGFDGPCSSDFWPKVSEVASGNLIKRINSLWVENVGPDLMWMTPEQVTHEIRVHIGRGVDFIKYASNDHLGGFIAFSERVQSVLVDEAHRAGIAAQAHIHTVEGLRIAIEMGCDLIQHANITGPVPIPEETLQLMVDHKTGAVVFPFTQRRLDVIMKGNEWTSRTFANIDTNCRNLIRCGASLVLATDGGIFAADAATDPLMKTSWAASGEDNLNDLGQGHFFWLKAMEEKGLAPMEMLRAATRNVAVAYGKEKDLGTLEPGKIADLLVLDQDPLQSTDHYRSIHMIIKDGVIVDRDALPINPILTQPAAAPFEKAAYYGR
jgi:imidazolonepropionase-like amidohydrolase